MQDLGADEAINYNKEDFLEVLKAKTSDKKFATGVPIIGSTQKWGVDVILDLVGAGNFTKNIDALNLEGRLLLVGTGSGIQSEINLAKVKIAPSARFYPQSKILRMLDHYLNNTSRMWSEEVTENFASGLF